MNGKENFMKWDNPGIALITGASSGIGAEFARQLAAQGFDLILVARRKEKLDALSRELQERFSVNTEVWVADLSKSANNDELVSKISQLDNLNVLINNAGFGINNTFLQIDVKLLADMINVHLTSPVMFCHAAIPGMLKRKRGVIINTSSMSAFVRSSRSVLYPVTKAAITIFSEIIQRSFRRTGIYIQSLCPGFTYSEFHDTETMKGSDRSLHPEEEWMTAEEVVSLSLETVKTKEVIFIPGEFNQKNIKDIRKATVNKYLKATML